MSESTEIRSGRWDGLDSVVPAPDPIGLEEAMLLTAEQYRAKLVEQGDGCGICGRAERDMRVDFHPVTDEVRGVLCPPCFSALTLAGYDSGRLQAMLGYLHRDGGNAHAR